MRTHLNTLFITLEGAYLRKDGAAVEVRHEKRTKLRVPLHNLEGIVCFGWDCTASAALMGACAEADVSLSFHTPYGKFLAASRGFTSGNILLRRAQYRAADSPEASLAIARNCVAAKITNSRHILKRAARDHGQKNLQHAEKLILTAEQLTHRIRYAQAATSLDSLRGIEGDAATLYFAAFNSMLTNNSFQLSGRNKRPPTDPLNALLSFLYTLLAHDCRSALESCGLDPQCGFLHRDRSGRPSLALDLMEEFRPLLADRATLTLINRNQIKTSDFKDTENGAVLLKDDARKTVLKHWQERKQSEILHPLLEEKVSLGLLPQLQARLLSRYLRGDIDAYPAYLAR
jgi:CRISPR-associated protein Cas1